MKSPFPLYRKGTIAICLLTLLALMLLASGCTQPAAQQQQQAPAPQQQQATASQQQQQVPAPITVTRTDSSHLTIAYPGSPDTNMLLELEATVTDSAGKTQTRSVGDHLSTTPLKIGATIPLSGTFGGNNHVLVTGYFMDGSHKLMLDTTI